MPFDSNRVRRAVEEILGNEALLEGLDEATASELQQWGISLAEQIVHAAHSLDDSAADALTGPRLRALRKWMRLVRGWLAMQEKMSPEERQRQWERLAAQSRELYGAHVSLPPMERLTGKSPLDALKELRSWLEPSLI